MEGYKYMLLRDKDPLKLKWNEEVVRHMRAENWKDDPENTPDFIVVRQVPIWRAIWNFLRRKQQVKWF